MYRQNMQFSGLQFSVHEAAIVCKWFMMVLDFSIMWPRIALLHTPIFPFLKEFLPTPLQVLGTIFSWHLISTLLQCCALVLFSPRPLNALVFIQEVCILPLFFYGTESSKTIFMAKKRLWSLSSTSQVFPLCCYQGNESGFSGMTFICAELWSQGKEPLGLILQEHKLRRIFQV